MSSKIKPAKEIKRGEKERARRKKGREEFSFHNGHF